MKKVPLICLLFCVITACAGTPPFLGYVIAKTALDSARKVDSATNASPYWVKAIHYYQRGQTSFRERDYISADRFFNESIKWFEKAENFSRFKISTGAGV